jgi:MFS family permease
MKFDWWLTGICFSRVFNGLVFMTYAAALPVLQKEWQMSAVAAGSIASGFQIGYAVSLVIFSTLADRISPKLLYLWSMSWAALLSLGFAFLARDYLSALLLYTVVAISLGGTYTTGLMILADQYPAKRRGMAMGFFIASTSLGYALSLFLSGIALPVGGYRLSFFLTCLGPLVGSILAWMTLFKTEVPAQKRQEGQRFMKDVLGNRPARLLISGYTFHSWELLGLWAWTPAFLASCLAIGGTEGLRAAGFGSYIAALFHVTGLLASFSMGALSDHLGRARVILLMSGISMVCSFVFGWSIGWPFILVMGIGLIYAFSALGDSPVLSAALTEAVDVQYLGASFGLRSFLGFGAGSISPLVFGAVLDWTNPITSTLIHYTTWGWAYIILGLGGLGAVWTAYRFGKILNETTTY